MNPALLFGALRLNQRRSGAAPAPPPGGLTVDLQLRYLDTSGALQSVDASDGSVSITVDAPARIRFDASGSRSVETDADDKPGAMLYLGYEWDTGDDGGSDWPYAGPQGAVRIGYGRRTPREDHIYTTPGTYTARVRVKDSAATEVTVPVEIVVRDPLTVMTRVDLTTGMGAWPTLVSGRCYTFDGYYDSWGVPNTDGLVNVVFMRHPSAGSTPSIAGLTLDGRDEGDINTTITRSRGIRADGIDVGPLRWGITGFDWCSVSNGRVSSMGPTIDVAYVWRESLIQPWGNETVANNIRLPDGLCLWNTGELNTYGDYVLFTPDVTDLGLYGVDLCKNSGSGGGQVFRGRMRRAIQLHCRYRNTVDSTGYGRFEGGECRSANGDVPDEWRDDCRVGDYAGGYQYGYASEDNIVTNYYMGAAGEDQPSNGFGTGPENNIEGQPKQGQRYCYFENGYIHSPGVSAAFGGGLWVGARHIRYASDESAVPIAWNNEGAGPGGVGGNYNRLPPGENGPRINEATSTRPVPTPF